MSHLCWGGVVLHYINSSTVLAGLLEVLETRKLGQIIQTPNYPKKICYEIVKKYKIGTGKLYVYMYT